MKKKRNIALVLGFLLAGSIWLFAADNDVTMSQVDGTDNKFVTVAAVANGIVGFDGSSNLVAKTLTAVQTPWTQDIDADGFDLRDLSNIEFRTTTGAPAGTVQAIWADAGGINLNVPTGDLFDVLVNNVTQMTVSVSTVDLQGNILTDVLDITSITSLNGVAIANYILSTDNLGALSATTSAQFAGVISNATGTGLVPLATNPTFTGLTATGTMDLSGGTFDVTLNAAVDALNFDSNTLSIDALNNRVGIGTAAPGELLSLVSADDAIPTNIVAFRANNLTVGIGIGFRTLRALATGANANLELMGKGTGNVIITGTEGNTGNVGIFQSDPQDRLEVSGGAILASAPTLNGATNFERLSLSMANGGDATITTEAGGTGVAGDLILDSASGLIGINTTAPSSTLDVNGIISGTDDAETLGVAATTFAVTSNFATITGDGGGNTIATITGGVAGQQLILLFVDANVTITDDNTHAADSLDLSAAFTSAPDTTISFIGNGTSWYETSRSVN